MRRPNVVLLMSMSPRKKLGVFVRLNASPLSSKRWRSVIRIRFDEREVDAELRRAVEAQNRQVSNLAGAGLKNTWPLKPAAFARLSAPTARPVTGSMTFGSIQ